MLVEPGMLLINNSVEKYPYITMSLIDYLHQYALLWDKSMIADF